MATKSELLQQAEVIRTQQEESGNTADLVGSLLKSIILYATESVEFFKGIGIISSEEMDDVLGGAVPVYLADAEGNVITDSDGNPIEII